MHNIDTHAAILIVVMAVITFLLRSLPFLIFPQDKKVPAYVTYLGNILPEAIIAMLVIYCLRDISFLSGSHGIPELIAVGVVVFLQSWKHKSLVSILGGTVVYMVLVQTVFS